MATRKSTPPKSLEKVLWATADKLRKNIDAAEYKHIVLGLIFLRYISEAFEQRHAALVAEPEADPEYEHEYLGHNILFVPPQARWAHLSAHAKQPDIGQRIDQAMELLEKKHPDLKGVLPKVYARAQLDSITLGQLIDEISNITVKTTKEESADFLGRVFEYFLGEFALAEGKKGGQFYTPKSVVELLVAMLEPYKGRIFDPCCGSGGMFVQSEKFVQEHQGNTKELALYGQESNQTTWRLAKMNLIIRGLDSSNIKWNSEGSFLKDAHKDLKADYVIANPPFNDSDWSGELLRDDARWKYGTPPTGNANYAWIQHFLHHLKPDGQAGFVLSKGALTTQQSGEGEIRKQLVAKGIINCIVNLPAKLFLNTQIPASLWFMSRKPATPQADHQILFIDASKLGTLINRRTRILTPADIQHIATTYHAWRKGEEGYQNTLGFCKSVPIAQVQALDNALTPGRYVGTAKEEGTFDFQSRFATLKATLEEQLQEEQVLNEKIAQSLATITLES